MLEIVSQSELNQPVMSQPSRFAAAPSTKTTSTRTTILCRWKRLLCGAVTGAAASASVIPPHFVTGRGGASSPSDDSPEPPARQAGTRVRGRCRARAGLACRNALADDAHILGARARARRPAVAHRAL